MNILILGPESRNKYLIDFFRERGYKFSRTTEPVTLEYLRDSQVDYMISYGYAPVVKPPVISEYRHRIVNVHPAYLPEGRGIYTNFWSFFEGRPKGVSVHFIDQGIDTGEILARQEVVLGSEETLRTSHEKLDRAVERLFIHIWDDLVAGKLVAVDQQTLTDRSYYRNRVESERLMDLLPQGWDTAVGYVEEMGAEFFASIEFWKTYDEEAGGAKDGK